MNLDTTDSVVILANFKSNYNNIYFLFISPYFLCSPIYSITYLCILFILLFIVFFVCYYLSNKVVKNVSALLSYYTFD